MAVTLPLMMIKNGSLDDRSSLYNSAGELSKALGNLANLANLTILNLAGKSRSGGCPLELFEVI